MRKKLRKLVSMTAALVMTLSMMTVNVFAIDIDKTADSILDENNQTTVTISVGGTQDVENVAVLFVLDYSTSVSVRNEAGNFLTELASKENTNVVAAVVDYSSVASATVWTTINDDTDTSAETGLLKSKTSSGTNYHAGLLAAQELLEDKAIEGYTTYLITISDGITYLWTDDDASSETYGSTMSVWVRSGSKGEEYFYNDNSVYELKYGSGVKIDENQFNALTSGKLTYGDVDLSDAYSNTIEIATEYPGTNPANDSSVSYVAADKYDDYLIGTEVAIYKTTSVYSKLLETVDYAYAFKMDEGNWTNFPYGEQLMNYLIDVSDNSGDTADGVISDDTAKSVFSTISDQILYEIMSGTVTDVIGEDFDWGGMDTVTLTVGGTELEGTVSGNSISFDNGNYVVTYYPDDEEAETSEYFTWKINVPVEAANGLKLSYDLVLNENYELPDSGNDVLPTNESAVIEYEDPDGEEKSEEFPVPEVVIGGDKISEPGMDKTIVVTDEDGNKTEVDLDDVAAGDTVTFALDSTIPQDLAEHITFTMDENNKAVGTVNSTTTTDEETSEETTVTDTYYLVFHDVMDEGLTLDGSSITVTIGNTELDSSYYTVTTENGDNCTFEVSIELLQLYTDGIISYSYFGSATITVTYSATLDKEAAGGSYNNKAWVTYDGTDSVEDTVTVKTYDLSIYKFDQSVVKDGEYTKGLDGAEFRLLKKVEDGTAGAESIGDGYYIEVEERETSDDDGYATFSGLDTGTYYIQETKAPTGYVASDALLEVTISSDAATDNVVSVSFANAPIPSTGGMGTTIFRIVGLSLLLAAGAVYVFTLRRRKED